MLGNVIYYNEVRGYGFIIGENEKDYFFHKSDFAYNDLISKGLEVEFIESNSSKGLKAKNVRVYKNEYRSVQKEYNNKRITKGIKQNLNIKGDIDEKKIITKFSYYFGITFSREEKFKEKFYRFNFLQPSESYQKSFNMFNEVLLLFSPFDSYDNRAMDFVDKTFSEYNNRLDKIIVFLVSKDQNIKNLISTESEDRIVVPFSYKEILDEHFGETIIQSRLRSYFYQRDLFAMESPLKSDSYFYGRKDLVHNIYAKYSMGENYGLFGLRKTGKTSVLYAAERTIEANNGISIYVDCQDTSIYKLRWYELLEEITKKIDQKYHFKLLKDLKLKFSEKSASNDFIEYLKLVHKRSNKRILLIFDEIEHISFDLSDELHWRDGSDYLSFWRSIRAKIQSNPNLISFMIAGVNPWIIEKASVNNNDNPIFNFASIRYLDLFKHNDVKNMVNEIGGYMGLSFDESVVVRLHENYGGHPFLIRNVCSMLAKQFKTRPYTINKRDYDENKNEIDKKLSQYIQSIVFVLKRWYNREFEILKSISLGNEIKHLETSDHDIDSINHLLSYGIVTKDLNFKLYIEIDAIRKYMKSEYNNEYLPSNEDELRQLVMSRRTKIEKELRQIIPIVLKVPYDNDSLYKTVLPKYVKVDEVKLRREDGEVWNGLYFSELRKIINGEYNSFKNILNIKQYAFNEAMDAINSFREVDAHAGYITKEEYSDLHIYFNALERVLNIK
ncbi:cold shock domain-containing protein [Staphylococcus saprophyticus]|nr:cold shock domain-containing protein [Staphylococcus saprophyticus]MDW4083025.1 cold shock domain-containing protein [Staphylococcus saprophyticus]